MDFMSSEPEPLSPTLGPPPRYHSPSIRSSHGRERDDPTLDPSHWDSVIAPRPDDFTMGTSPSNSRTTEIANPHLSLPTSARMRQSLPGTPAPIDPTLLQRSPNFSRPIFGDASSPDDVYQDYPRGRDREYSHSSGSSQGRPTSGIMEIPRAEPPSPNASAPANSPPKRRATDAASRITRFSFSTLSWNSMILAPAEVVTTELRVGQSKYHISVGMNCFIPGTSFITTIRRGGSEHGGEIVGEIELGNPEHKTKGGTVRIGNTRVWIAKALKRGAGNHKTAAFGWKNPWCWEFPGQCQLLWNFSENVKRCHRIHYTGGRDLTPLVATFTPPQTYGEDVVVVSSPAIIEASLDSQETFDHIVISALILERKRLLPSVKD